MYRHTIHDGVKKTMDLYILIPVLFLYTFFVHNETPHRDDAGATLFVSDKQSILLDLRDIGLPFSSGFSFVRAAL